MGEIIVPLTRPVWWGILYPLPVLSMGHLSTTIETTLVNGTIILALHCFELSLDKRRDYVNNAMRSMKRGVPRHRTLGFRDGLPSLTGDTPPPPF